jgi:hypothetical protein
MISLYLSDDRIRLVEGTVKKNKIYIKKLIETESKAGSLESGNVKDVLELSQVVQEMLNTNEIKPQKTYVVLDNSRIVFREAVMPNLPEKKLKLVLVSEFFADGKQKNNIIDYIIDEKFTDEDKSKKLKVHITYQTLDSINSIKKACQELSLKLNAIDIAQNAISKLYSEYFKDIAGTNLLIDYKDTFLSLYVFEDGIRKFSKSSIFYAKPGTGNDFADMEYFVNEMQSNIGSIARYYESKNENKTINAVYMTGNIGVMNDECIQRIANAAKYKVSYLPCPESIIGIDVTDFNKFSCTIGGFIRR